MVRDIRTVDNYHELDEEIAQLKFDIEIQKKLLKLHILGKNLAQIESEIIVAYNLRYIVRIDGSVPVFLDSVDDITPLQQVYDIPDDIDNDERAQIMIQRIHSELDGKPGNENILDMIQQYSVVLDEKSRYESTLPEGFVDLYDSDSDDEDSQV
jgi:hypothetical protein